MKTTLPFLALILLANIAMAQMPCTNDCAGEPANPIMPGPWTNVAGMPIVRIVSIHGSASATNLGELISTNLGFVIVSNQVTTRYEQRVPTNQITYYHFTLGAINTATNRRYSFLFAYEYVDGTYFPLDLGWNGVGTNEYRLFDYIIYAANADVAFFKLIDVGAAQ